MEEKDLKQECLNLMETAEAVYLSTIDENGFPQTRSMLNLRNTEQFANLVKMYEGHKDDFLVFLTTGNASSKIQQIKANTKVSVYFCKPNEFLGLMLGGKIEIVTDTAIKKSLWQDGWEMYYPSGVDGPEYTILRLLPAFAKGWYKEGPFEFKLK